MASLTHNQVIEAKTGDLFVLRWVLHYADTNLLIKALDLKMKQSGDFFRNEAIVLDANLIQKAPDWKLLQEAMKQHGLYLLGVTAPVSLFDSIKQAGLPILNFDKQAPATVKEAKTVAKPTEKAQPKPADPAPVPRATTPRTPEPAPASFASGGDVPAPPMIIERHLRSGQRVYAKNTDLIVIGTVSAGAEVIADGNVHIYGALRGRAVAGAKGDEKAKIFCTHLEAEMLVIAGVYKVIDSQLDPNLVNHPVMVELKQSKLEIRQVI
ncbi:septum site-determining protein MinC [Basilea psittacipulmonis]|uniref:Probable septum site-determining protein MinC n=1 Tax=Basilea psittacipulmonis DSM 24701 TaxID=1072685 RepID=A0A077DGA5_9BURK|nr:septum site-determining protein MinC [Basilea psittacipulmonis]AIL32183.1 hypothetical protein IX83_01620 [Basilea psittacipulmonis DSM 24701]